MKHSIKSKNYLKKSLTTTKIFLPILAFIFTQTGLFSIELKYRFEPGSKFKVETNIQGSQSINRSAPFLYTQYYKVNTNIIEIDESGIALIQDDGYYYINDNINNNDIQEIKENILVKYHKDSKGTTFVPVASIFPVMRNIPMFPDENVIPGTTWESEGLEVHDFFSTNSISQLPVKVSYKFIGVDSDPLQTAEISYICNIDVTNTGDNSIDPKIYKVTGTSNNTLFFSLKENRPLKEIYERDYVIITSSMDMYRFIDSGNRVWNKIESTIDKKKELAKIENDIKDQELEDVNISETTDGLKLSLENISFEPDSAVLTKQEALRLKEIAKILTKYKDKHIRIVGHTADRGTPEAQMKLSALRAKAVAKELLHYNAITSKNTEIQGKGASEPIASNKTEKDRKKNRRVEIFITEE
ncbi:MAG: OmpA family protein [Spirochaetales bacterium]|nr:OmpA family protein [Spirochaetales bacterium]